MDGRNLPKKENHVSNKAMIGFTESFRFVLPGCIMLSRYLEMGDWNWKQQNY
jgi:hypothetical protein